MFNPTVSDESVLQTCANLSKKGGMYHVNAYRYGEENKRKTCFRLKKEGRLKQGATHNKLLTFYRPEDEQTIKSAKEKFRQEMKKIHAENVDWHIEQAKKNTFLYDYHMKEAEKERLLSL